MANTDNRVKPIFINDQDSGDRYELDFNREAIKFAEARKFDPSDIASYPTTKIPEFFFYAFRMHHKSLSRNQTDRVLETLGGLTESLQTDEELEKNSRMTVEMD